MPRDTAALLERVKKLLALATSPNVHEAAAAAARAQELIEKHRLDALLEAERDDTRDPIDDGRDAPLETSKRLRRWKVQLASVLGEHNGCVAWTDERGAFTALCIAGRASDREAVAALYAWLVTKIELLSATHGAGRDRRWHEAFRVGAAEAIAERLADANRTTHDAMPEVALVTIDAALAARNAAVDRFVEENLRLGKGRAFLVDARAYERGRAEGARAALDERKR